MSVVFSESGKHLSLSIDGYESDYSPDEITSKTDKYHMNWLTVRIDYSENGKEIYISQAMTLNELCETNEKTQRTKPPLPCKMLKSLKLRLDNITSDKQKNILTKPYSSVIISS